MTATQRATLTVVPKGEGSAWRDRELVAALLAHDAHAPIIAYRRFAPRVFAIVQRTVGPSADAEDLTQDIFLRVFSRVHTLRDPDAFSSFVLSVTLRVIKWQLRQRRVRRIMRLSDDGRVPEIAVPGMDSEARQGLARLYRFLDTLPVEERTVFVLRQMQGMDLQEVAGVIGMSLATVKRRFTRARDRLNARIRVDSALRAYSSGATSHDG
jgi:RNA polymerase sigma-70 factor (ECF subfamily)